MRRTFASRILAGYLLVFGIASWVFYDSLLQEIKPVVRQASESVMIDTANLLAELVAEDVANNALFNLSAQMEEVNERPVSALVWGHLRTQVLLDFYITNAKGRVLFSSEGRDVGADYSQWRDVYLTLRGQYGARSTLADPYQPESSVMHVAAPILKNGEIIGVLTVYNSNQTMQPFVEASKRTVLKKWLLVLLACGVVALLLSFWLSRSVAQLSRFAKGVESGEAPKVPKLLGSELNDLAKALDEMRVKLEGKAYVEHYVQTLTHELKSPMAAIRGAAEMLLENPPEEIKDRFLHNINEQNLRMQRTVDQMLRLAALENQSSEINHQVLAAGLLVQQGVDSIRGTAEKRNIQINIEVREDFSLEGDQDLMLLALGNVLENALAFSSPASTIVVTVDQRRITLTDQGEGIPDYALTKVGHKFFSLPRPGGEPKSTGLGLALTQEICRRHHAELSIGNRTDGEKGVVVVFGPFG